MEEKTGDHYGHHLMRDLKSGVETRSTFRAVWPGENGCESCQDPDPKI